MSGFVLRPSIDPLPLAVHTKFRQFLWYHFRDLKFDSPVTLTFFVLIVIVTDIIIAKSGIFGAVVVGAVFVGIPFMLASMFNLRFGISAVIVLSFVVLGVKRAVSGIQLGLLIDGLIAVMVFGLFIRQVHERNWNFAKNPISKAMAVWIAYTVLQVVNPTAESQLAWVYTIRQTAGFMVLYLIVLYAIDQVSFITRIMKIWILFALLAALWGYYQEIFGFLPFELHSIIEEGKMGLWFINGHFRKFSFFSDPMVFGIVMSYSSILCFAMLGAPISSGKKIFLGAAGIFMLNAMLFSGTRAAYVLPVAALFFYALLTFRKNVIRIAGVMVLAGIVIINVPSSNPNIRRFQSAFHPQNDASYQLRAKNQAYIQPYIQTHPFGGGLGSTGTWGQRFSKNSQLANFPPDSGFVRTAVELGWIGLIIQGTLMFVVLSFGVKGYYRMKDPRLKAYNAALLTVFYAMVVANFPQEALIQFPTSILIYVIIAMINKIVLLDGEMAVIKP